MGAIAKAINEGSTGTAINEGSARTVVITGAGGALGGAVAATFQQAGWNLGLFEYGAQGAERLRAEYDEAVVVDVDLTNETATASAVENVLSANGRVDALLCIAGGFAMSKAHKSSIADLEHMLDLNVRTLFNSVRAVLPSMLDKGSGFILGVSAGAALGGSAGMALYAASKSAVATYLDSVRIEMKGRGIRVTTLYVMDALDTPANRKSMPGTDPAGWISLEGLADVILTIAESDPRAHVGEVKVEAKG
jgi:NADP-dependent 3-hydroxy acid dehydrogenase YdfG